MMSLGHCLFWAHPISGPVSHFLTKLYLTSAKAGQLLLWAAVQSATWEVTKMLTSKETHNSPIKMCLLTNPVGSWFIIFVTFPNSGFRSPVSLSFIAYVLKQMQSYDVKQKVTVFHISFPVLLLLHTISFLFFPLLSLFECRISFTAAWKWNTLQRTQWWHFHPHSIFRIWIRFISKLV